MTFALRMATQGERDMFGLGIVGVIILIIIVLFLLGIIG